MLLRKFPMTPARLEANRRNAQKSTGPRTPRGKSQSRLNGLRSGFRSRLYEDFLLALLNAPPGTIIKTARAVLTPAQAAHPMFAQLVYIFCKSQNEMALHYRKLFGARDS
jgi:hypothetical protein